MKKIIFILSVIAALTANAQNQNEYYITINNYDIIITSDVLKPFEESVDDAFRYIENWRRYCYSLKEDNYKREIPVTFPRVTVLGEDGNKYNAELHLIFRYKARNERTLSDSSFVEYVFMTTDGNVIKRFELDETFSNKSKTRGLRNLLSRLVEFEEEFKEDVERRLPVIPIKMFVNHNSL